MRPATGRVLHALFDVGVVLKGVDGALETVGGALLLFVTPEQLYRAARILTLHELTEDPRDFVASHLLAAAGRLTMSAVLFGALYLLAHGLVKIGLVAALLRSRLWAYPVAIAVFLLFLAYQLYRYARTGSPPLLAVSVLDAAVVALTWVEYRRRRATPSA